MNFTELIKLAADVASLVKVLMRNFEQVKGTLNQDQLDQLNPILESIHAENMLLSKEIDDAAAEAEKKA